MLQIIDTKTQLSGSESNNYIEREEINFSFALYGLLQRLTDCKEM